MGDSEKKFPPKKSARKGFRQPWNSKMKQFNCAACPDTKFANELAYLQHLAEQHQGQRVAGAICAECGRMFGNKGELVAHMHTKCGTQKRFECTVCAQMMASAGSLQTHMLRHGGDKRFLCRFCTKQFITKSALNVHERTHTKDKVFVCEICGKGFSHRQSIVTHSTIHTGVKPFVCEYCDRGFSCIGNLLKHRRVQALTCGAQPLNSHTVGNQETKIKLMINTPITARRKNYSAYRMKQLKCNGNTNLSEDKQEDSANDFICSEDNVDFYQSDTDQLAQDVKDPLMDKRHVDGFDSEDSIPLASLQSKPTPNEVVVVAQLEANKKSTLTCAKCGKSFKTINWLKRHEKTHLSDADVDSPVKKFKCTCCHLMFASSIECNDHKRNLHLDQLKCDICDKVLGSPDRLRRHRFLKHSKTVDGKKLAYPKYEYACDKCGAKFRHKSSLAEHVSKGCADGPLFKCDICDKKFGNIYAKKSHMTVHNNVKEHLCTFCGKVFNWKGQLKIHMRSHTGDKPFKCTECPKAFAYRDSLVTHLSVHTGNRKYSCQTCNKKFSCYGNLHKHRVRRAGNCRNEFEIKDLVAS